MGSHYYLQQPRGTKITWPEILAKRHSFLPLRLPNEVMTWPQWRFIDRLYELENCLPVRQDISLRSPGIGHTGTRPTGTYDGDVDVNLETRNENVGNARNTKCYVLIPTNIIIRTNTFLARHSSSVRSGHVNCMGQSLSWVRFLAGVTFFSSPQRQDRFIIIIITYSVSFQRRKPV
jgi:hypothetical protein